MEDRLKDPLFRNWVKAALLLDFANDALREFVEPLLVKQHRAITQRILSRGAQLCNGCTFRTALQCPTNICRQLILEIEAANRCPKLTFDNTTIQDCWRNPWEIAKCFMPFGYDHVHTALETDFAGITSLIINDLEFDNHVTEDLSDDNNIYRQAKDIRNIIMHTSSFQIKDVTFNGYRDFMTKLISSLNTPTAFRAISRIQKLDSNSISPADASYVISQAVSSLEKYVDELKHQIIPEMRKMSDRLRDETDKGVATLTDVVSKGVEDIKQKTQDGINKLQHQTETSKLDIDNQTSKAKGEIETLKDDGLISITSTTDANTKKLDEQGEEITGSITDRANREKEYIADEGKRIRDEESERLKREAEINRKHIHDIAEDSKIRLDNEIETTMKTLRETESESLKKTGQIAEDVLAKTKVLEKIRNDGLHTIQDITHKCIDSLCRETTDFEKKVQDIRTSTANSFRQLLDKEAENSVKVSSERMNKELKVEVTEFRQEIKDEVESSVNAFREQLEDVRIREQLEDVRKEVTKFREQIEDEVESSVNAFRQQLKDIREEANSQLLDKEAENSVKVSRVQLNKELTAEVTEFRQQIKDDVESSVNAFRQQLKDIREEEKDYQEQKKDKDETCPTSVNDLLDNDVSAKEKDFQEQMKDVEENRLTSSDEESVAEDIHERSMPLDTDQELTSFREEDTPMKEHASLNIEHESDERRTHITGMVKFDETRLAVVDRNNNSVKVVDVRQDTITSRIKLKRRRIRDITSVNEHQLAVTTKDKVIILQFYHDELSVERELIVKGDLRGIVYNNGTFIVSLDTSPITFKILSMDGKVLRSFTVNNSGGSVYAENSALALYNQSLFITDALCHSVVCVSLEGTIQHVYNHDRLMHPTGITVGRDGDVYVAGADSYDVHIISPQYEHKGIVPDIILRKPFALEYCKHEHKLYISQAENNVVRVTTLKLPIQG